MSDKALVDARAEDDIVLRIFRNYPSDFLTVNDVCKVARFNNIYDAIQWKVLGAVRRLYKAGMLTAVLGNYKIKPSAMPEKPRENFPCRNEGCDRSFRVRGERTLHELTECEHTYQMSRRTAILAALIIGGALSIAFAFANI